MTQGGRDNLEIILVQVCEPVFFKPIPILYLVFEKNDVFIYLIEQNVNIFIHCSLISIPYLLSVNTVYK